MPLRRPLTSLLLVMLAGTASAQEAHRVPQTEIASRVRTSLGTMDLTIATPDARRSVATVRDRSPGKPAALAQSVTLTSRVILKADAGAQRALADAGYALAPAAAGYITIDTGSVAEAKDLAGALAGMPGVTSAAAEALAPLTNRSPLNDDFYSLAWHLNNDVIPTNDVNAEAAWMMGYTGEGVAIGVVDSGVWSFHPDLSGKRIAAASQAGASSQHGTACAGVALAQGNNEEGAAGIAYNADYANLYYSPPGDPVVNAEAFTFGNTLLHVKNNSWGPFDNGLLRTIADIENDALIEAVTTGREGKGVVMVWAAGNGGGGDRVDYDPYASSPYTIAIGAITDKALRANYSERGSSLFAVTYSSGSGGDRSIVAPNNSSATPYIFTFGGTSSAAPLASGLVALCLEANPDLTWRDVQHLIVKAAEPVAETDSDWTLNGAGIPVNHNFGFGQLDAVRMINEALSWTPVAPQIALDAGEIHTPTPIPDNDPAGIDIPFEVTDNIVIEHVAAHIEIEGSYIGDLQITLTSPSGTQSILHTQHNNSADVMDHTFRSVRCWDEQAIGTWTLNIADLAEQDTHTLNSFSLSFLGTAFNCPADQDGDNILTTDDFLAWVTNYQNGDMRADVNKSGTLEPADFSAWIAAYNKGC